MKWFEGGIPQAIQTSKNDQAVFIVFISGGEDDASKQMESHLHQKAVTEMCEANRCVAVKLLKDSNDCKFFSQIFPVVVIPSTFFIGDTGTPLEVIGEAKSAEAFHDKVKAVITSHKEGLSTQPAQKGDLTAKQGSSQDVGSRSQAEGGAAAASGLNEGNGDEGMTEKSDLPLEDKVERAKELVRLKQEQKAQEESESARSKENERRKVGQEVQKLRENQKEQEMLEAKQELRKDRDADKIARQRVKEQIARDRAEKNARFSEAKQERDTEVAEAKKRKLVEQQAAAEAEAARRSDVARLQFRMADGSSITQQFDATDTFSAVYHFITGHMGHEVTLSTAFPRRNFTRTDHNSTLQELSLAPTAVILVLSQGIRSPVSGGGGGIAIANVLLSPLYFLWSMLTSLFGWSTTAASSSSTTSTTGRQSATSRPSSTVPQQSQNKSGASATPTQNLNRSASGGDRDPGSARKREGATSRQQGSIHKFHNAEDDEDDKDKATWNGNSTQQM